MGIVFDTSGSIGDKMGKSRQAIAQFLRTANPQDECFLLQFSDRPEVVVDFTTRVETLQSQVNFLPSRGRTAFFDAVVVAIHKMKEAKHARKALMIISDRADNYSRYTKNDIKQMVREADVQIYTIGIFEPIATRRRSIEELAGPELLDELAETTGGRMFAVSNLNELPEIAETIGVTLRNQYVIGYTPTDQTKDGKWRRVKVEINPVKGMPRLHTYFRRGYYAPAH
jgi:Ca-activated chloride channel family protein